MEAAPPLFGDADRRQSGRQPVAEWKGPLAGCCLNPCLPILHLPQWAVIFWRRSVGNNEDSITVQAAEESAAVRQLSEIVRVANYRDVNAHVAPVKSQPPPPSC